MYLKYLISKQAIFHHVSEKAYAQRKITSQNPFSFWWLFNSRGQSMWGIPFVQIAGMTGSYSTLFPTKIMKGRQWKHEDWLELSHASSLPPPHFQAREIRSSSRCCLSPQPRDRLETHTYTHTTTTYQKSRWLGLPSSPPPIAVIRLLLKRVTGLVG